MLQINTIDPQAYALQIVFFLADISCLIASRYFWTKAFPFTVYGKKVKYKVRLVEGENDDSVVG